VKLTADTDILVRVVLNDDPGQSTLAIAALSAAEIIAVTLPALCEFVWVLGRGYKREARDIAAAIRHLIDSPAVQVDRPAIQAGLAVLEAGGDFADGVIAFEGHRLGGEIFLSFDAGAVKRLKAGGVQARLLSNTRPD
jgi:predicted nucleic-acid-binding protein